MQQPIFRERLMEARKAKGLTQEDVARMCGISVRTIQRIELGEVNPRAYTIKLLSDALGMEFFDSDKALDDSKTKSMKDSVRSVVYASAIVGFAIVFSTIVVVNGIAAAMFLMVPTLLISLLVWGIVSKRKSLWITSLVLLVLYFATLLPMSIVRKNPTITKSETVSSR